MHASPIPRIWIIAAIMMGVLVGGAAIARAADKAWRNALGGPFSDPANWSGGSVAGVNDIAHFGLSGGTFVGYDVTFSVSVGNVALRVEDDSVAFLLNGRSYNTHSTSENHVGTVAGRSGALFVSGGTVDVTTVPVLIGAVATASGTLTISTGGRLVSSSGIIRVGHLGTGTLTVENGGVVQSTTDVVLAQNPGTTGTANVTGATSVLGTGALTVGNQGGGALNISNGGQAQNTTATVGNLAGSTGSVANNAGTHSVTGTLTLGSSAGATGNYQLNGGLLLAPSQAIGSQGSATFTQIGGENTATTQLDVGAGSGSNGAYSLQDGIVIVDGPMSAGFSGTGTVTQWGGYVSVAMNLRVAPSPSGNGHYTLDGDGFVEAGLSTVGGTGGFPGGTGRIDIFSGIMSIAGRLKIWNTANTIVNLSGGTLITNELDTTGNASRFNWTGGALHVVTSTGSLTNQGGILAPGPTFFPPAYGTTTIAGGYTQQAAGAVQIEIGGLQAGTAFDRVNVSGIAAFDGKLELSLFDGFEPLIGQTFVIMTFGSRTGTFASVTGRVAGPGKLFQVQYNAGDVTLVVVPFVPGDMNLDGQLTPLDAGPLALALTNPAAFQQQFPNSEPLVGDLNQDGLLNGLDIGLFLACLISGCP